MSDAPIIPQRRCTKCGQEKPATLEFFYKQKAGKFGLASWCKDCHGEVNRANGHKWRENNKDRARESNKEWRKANPDRVKAWEKKSALKYRTALSRGGSNWPDNLVIACADCNLSKNDKTVQEWAGRLF